MVKKKKKVKDIGEEFYRQVRDYENKRLDEYKERALKRVFK